MTRTGFVVHERYFWHDTGTAALFAPPGQWVEPDWPHVESASSKRRLRNLVDAADLLPHLTQIRPEPAAEEDLLRFHTRDYVDRVRTLSEGVGGDAGLLAPVGRGSYPIALLSLGGMFAAADGLAAGELDTAYVLTRPPGHHALPDQGMGFCLFNNIALTVLRGRALHGLGRVAVVDWDVHHGNGTQSAFYDDPTVLTVSVHQDDCFPPRSGPMHETGRGAAEGANLNLPLPAGSGHGAYLAAFERVVVPALHAFRPDLIIVACGFDANAFDPLARMMLHSDSYRALARLVADAARQLCGGRLLLSHEGGYSPAYVPYCGLAVLEELSGVRTACQDPFLPIVAGQGGQDLAEHQDRVIAAAELLLPGVPTP